MANFEGIFWSPRQMPISCRPNSTVSRKARPRSSPAHGRPTTALSWPSKASVSSAKRTLPAAWKSSSSTGIKTWNGSAGACSSTSARPGRARPFPVELEDIFIGRYFREPAMRAFRGDGRPWRAGLFAALHGRRGAVHRVTFRPTVHPGRGQPL